MHAALQYTYADDYLTAREALRPAHLALGWEAVERGELLLGGVLGDGPFDGLLVFQGDDALGAAERFAAADPYVAHGLVTAWTAREWKTALGETATAPVRP
ncbi:YciI-like protein [Leifsonia poae]|uniref:YciI-like protein n=1 Tax=Leifsonia poae TaxID=110933 RepID=UPI003D69F61C